MAGFATLLLLLLLLQPVEVENHLHKMKKEDLLKFCKITLAQTRADLGSVAVRWPRATCSRRATRRRRGTGTWGCLAVCSSSSAQTQARSVPRSWPVCLLCSSAPHLKERRGKLSSARGAVTNHRVLWAPVEENQLRKFCHPQHQPFFLSPLHYPRCVCFV